MAGDIGPPGKVFNTPKGGLFGGAFDSSGLDPDVRAVLADQRWTTSFGGTTPPAVIPFAFPSTANDYLAAAGYPEWFSLQSFAPLTNGQKNAVRTAFNL